MADVKQMRIFCAEQIEVQQHLITNLELLIVGSNMKVITDFI